MQKKPYRWPYCLYCYRPFEVELATNSHGVGAQVKRRWKRWREAHIARAQTG